jgi:SET domain-containing protein
MPTKTRSRRPFRVGRSKTGFGLFATRLIKRGEFITYYKGRKLPNRIADELSTKYLFEINGRWTMDGSPRYNLARYINHACKANAEADTRGHKILITACRTIQEGDEITYNYGRSYFTTFIKPLGCKCAACDSQEMVVRSPRKGSKGPARKARKRRKGRATSTR